MKELFSSFILFFLLAPNLIISSENQRPPAPQSSPVAALHNSPEYHYFAFVEEPAPDGINYIGTYALPADRPETPTEPRADTPPPRTYSKEQLATALQRLVRARQAKKKSTPAKRKSAHFSSEQKQVSIQLFMLFKAFLSALIESCPHIIRFGPRSIPSNETINESSSSRS